MEKYTAAKIEELEKSKTYAIKELTEMKRLLECLTPSSDRAKKQMTKLIALVNKTIETIGTITHDSPNVAQSLDRIMKEFDAVAMEIDDALEEEMKGKIINS